jgi:hypothetical protein
MVVKVSLRVRFELKGVCLELVVKAGFWCGIRFELA